MRRGGTGECGCVCYSAAVRYTKEAYGRAKAGNEALGGVLFGKEVYLQQIKKKAKAEGKTCHAKTMLSLEKPIKLL